MKTKLLFIGIVCLCSSCGFSDDNPYTDELKKCNKEMERINENPDKYSKEYTDAVFHRGWELAEKHHQWNKEHNK